MKTNHRTCPTCGYELPNDDECRICEKRRLVARRRVAHSGGPSTQTLAPRKHKLYFVIILCVLFGVFFQFAGPYIGKWMASSAPHPAQEQKLQWFYQQSVFGPLSLPAQPVPALSVRLVPPSYYAFFGTVVGALLYLQIALLVRRIAICVRARKTQPPPSLNRVWKVILWVSLASWLVGVLMVLLPRLVFPLLGVESIKAIGFASAIVGVFIVPYFWVIPSNLFGPSFFVLELLSFRKEGFFPNPNTSSQ